MTIADRPTRRAGPFLLGLIWSLAAGMPLSGHTQELAYIDGRTAQSTERNGGGTLGDAVCTPEGLNTLIEAADLISSRVRSQLGSAAADAIDGSAEVASLVASGLCLSPDTTPIQLDMFRMIYAECRMTMYDSSGTVLDVRFPSGQNTGYMEIMDYNTREVFLQPIEFTAALAAGVASGTSPDQFLQWGGTESYTTQWLDENTRKLEQFRTSFTIDLGSMLGFMGDPENTPTVEELEMLNQIIGVPSIATSGSALVAPDAPGIDTVRAFYRRFAAVIESGQGGAALMSGLFNHFLLEEGMPLWLEQTTEIRMQSLASALPGVMIPNAIIPEATTTTTEIERIVLLPMEDGYCDSSIVPDGFAVSDPMGIQSSGRGAGSGGSGAASAGRGGAGETPPTEDLAAAMAGVNEAFANMSDEDRAAMEQFAGSFGALLGGALGGQSLPGAAAGAQAGAAAAGQAPAASAQSGRMRTGQSSAELMTDDLTQSVQSLLQALGYNPGNTDGEAGIETTIAISQFQAEKGLEVTGEVTPQLVGILAAEVDSR